MLPTPILKLLTFLLLQSYQCTTNPKEFLIIVIAWKRIQSLQRLLNSLTKAQYCGQLVNIKFVVEADPAKEVVDLVNEFEWKHGSITKDFKLVKHGLVMNIMTAWYPKRDNEYGIFLEDDVEVSPFFFRYLLDVFDKNEAEFERTNEGKNLAGLSLMVPMRNELEKIKASKDFYMEKRKGVDYDYFLMGLPCSWGSLYFPKHWRGFIEYYNKRVDDMSRVKMPILKTESNDWPNSWKKYFIEYIHMKGLVFVYPNYPTGLSFSTNHAEIGVHYGVKKEGEFKDHDRMRNRKDERITPCLVREYKESMKSGMSSFQDYPIYDMFFRRVKSIETLKSVGFYTTERYTKINKMKRSTINGSCALDLLNIKKGRIFGTGNDKKYIRQGMEMKDNKIDMENIRILFTMGKILKRDVILPNRIKRMAEDKRFPMIKAVLRDADVNFIFEDSKEDGLKILPIGEKYSRDGLKVIEEIGTVIIPSFYNERNEIYETYGGCSDRVLCFKSLEGLV